MKILVSIESYLPGTLGGGPVRALANLIDHLHVEHEFFIFTRNHDYLEASTYANIETNSWQRRGSVSIYYSDSKHAGAALFEQAKSLRPDWIYLNGALPPLTRQFLSSRRRHVSIRKTPVLLAPHGNLAKNALENNRFQKSIWLAYAKIRGLYRGVIWHAASEREAEQIQTCFGGNTQVRIVPMAPGLPAPTLRSLSSAPCSEPSETLRLVYFGRLSPEKNLPFAFDLLAQFATERPEQPVIYDLYGAGLVAFERKLHQLAKDLPSTVQVNFHGQFEPEALQARLQGSVESHEPATSGLPAFLPSPGATSYHALLMPSQTENFSYTVLESLQAGIPALISDQTPWRGLEEKGVGWDLSLGDPDLWLQALENLVSRDDKQAQIRRQQAIDYAHQHTAEYPNKAKQLFAEM